MKKTLRFALCVLLFVAVAFANTSGPNSGTTAGASWTSPGNAATTNAVYATCSATNSNCLGTLSGSSYGFSIPAGATITGITVAVVAHCSSTSSCDLGNTAGTPGTGICVTKVAATCTGTSKLDSTKWNTTDSTFTYGSGSDLWGTTWTPSNINGTGFGAVIDPENANALARTMSVDSILITVTFTQNSSGFLQLFSQKRGTMATHGYIGEEKARCERCGFEYHISQLMKQEGRLRCIKTCVDDLSNKYRRKQTQDILAANKREGTSDKPIIFKDPGEIVFE